jgi:hypothetical protein
MAKPILGTKNSDTLPGTNSADKILGKAGDDILQGLQGDDFINGGKGTDTAVFSGTREDYDIVFRGNGHGPVQVTDLRASPEDGSDRLINVELLSFADVTVDTSTGAVVGAGAGNVVVVHADGTFDSFATIADAVAAAIDDETIFIGSGTFEAGSILISEDLTIIGAEGTQINGGFFIGAGGDGTTIDNVAINGGAAVAGESGLIGIFVQADDVTITNSTFNGDANVATADRGILTSITDGQGLVISGNTFTGWNTGVYLNPGTDAQVTDNTFEDNNVGLSADQDETSNVLVTDNTFTDSAFEQIGFGVVGVGTSEDVGSQVFGNTFENTNPDVPEVSVYLLEADQTIGATIADDTFVYVDNAVAGEAWTINGFDPAADQINLNGVALAGDPVETATEVTLALETGDEIHLLGVNDFDPGWIVA